MERLFEKAMQELIERCDTLLERRGAFFSGIPLVLRCRLLLQLDLNIDDGRDDAVDERGKARQSNVDLALRFLSEIAAGVVATLGLRVSGANRRDKQSGASGACQRPAGMVKGYLSQPLSKSSLPTQTARLAPPGLKGNRATRTQSSRVNGIGAGRSEHAEAGQFPVEIGLQHLPQRRKRDYLRSIVPTSRPSMRGAGLLLWKSRENSRWDFSAPSPHS